MLLQTYKKKFLKKKKNLKSIWFLPFKLQLPQQTEISSKHLYS